MKKIPIIIALILALAVPAFAQQPAQRGVLFQIGAGPSFPSYPAEMEEFLDYLENEPEIDRVKIAVDLALVFPLWLPAISCCAWTASVTVLTTSESTCK